MEEIIINAVKLVKAVDAKMAVPPVWEITGLTGRWYFSDWKTCWNTGMSRWE